MAVTDYMNNGVAAIVQKNNVYGVQFSSREEPKSWSKAVTKLHKLVRGHFVKNSNNANFII